MTDACAGTLSTSLGYAFSNDADFNKPKGFNLKYGYEWENQLGLITSFTYLHSSEDSYPTENGVSLKNEKTSTYYSFGAGPTFRISQFISLYGLLGLSYTRNSNKSNTEDAETSDSDESIYYNTNHATSVMYGTGANINLPDDFLLNIGFERGSYKNENAASKSSDTFNINIGYKW